MKIALFDNDSTGYPNLVLMKLSSWHKLQGDEIEWFKPFFAKYDKIYSSKVFTWTQQNLTLPKSTICGGSGYDFTTKLDEEIEHICPDYSLYGCNQSYGFLTRGCIKKCDHCIVPKKEGMIRENADIEEFVNHKEVVLMDNNVLAHPHGISQIEKIGRLGLRVDFNQGLDSQLIDDRISKRLSKLKWLHPLRLACDSSSQIESVRKATELLRWHNVTPRRYSCYVLIKDVNEALEIIRSLKGLNVDPFAQPFRSQDGSEPTKEQKHLARWCNHKAIYTTCTWEEYKYNFIKEESDGIKSFFK